MIEVQFYNFAKRQNSTQIVTGTPKSVSVILKDDCTLEAPTFMLRCDNIAEYALYNYIHVPEFGRYYFIRNRVYLTGSQVDIICEEDVLASFKSEITTAPIAFVEYCGQYNQWNVDPRINNNGDTVITQDDGVFLNTNFMSDGCAILSSVGNNNTGLFIFGAAAQLYNLLTNIEWETPSEIIGEDIATVMTALGEGLYSIFEQFFSKEAAQKNIRSAFSLPWIPQRDAVGDAVEELVIGSYPTGKSCHRVAKEIVTDTATLSIPWQYNDWRRNPKFCNLVAYLPLVGLVPLSASALNDDSSIRITYAFSYSNGDLSYQIEGVQSGAIVSVGQVNAATPIGIGISNINTAKTGVGLSSAGIAAAGIAGAAVSGGLTLPLLAAGLGGAGAGFASAFAGMNQGIITGGGLGGYAGGELDPYPHIYCISCGFTDTPVNMGSTWGFPTFQTRSLAGLNGYVKCSGYQHIGAGSLSERQKIDEYVNGGFYIA